MLDNFISPEYSEVTTLGNTFERNNSSNPSSRQKRSYRGRIFGNDKVVSVHYGNPKLEPHLWYTLPPNSVKLGVAPGPFEWGVHSAPAQKLALTMLWHATDDMLIATLWYVRFTIEKVSLLPSKGWVMTHKDIERWLYIHDVVLH